MPEAPMWIENGPGRKYVTYVWKELPRLLRKWLALKDRDLAKMKVWMLK